MAQSLRIISPLQLGSVSCNEGQVFSVLTIGCRVGRTIVASSFPDKIALQETNFFLF